MERFCILLMAVLLSPFLNAQQTRWFKTSDPYVTVRGVITDAITGEGIHLASVVANGDGLNSVLSDSDGGYSIKAAPGEIELNFHAFGYKAEKININTEVDSTVNCSLQEEYMEGTLFYSYIPKRFEFDARFFNTFGFTNVSGTEQTLLGLEGRYNFRRLPMDVGLNFSYSTPFTMEPVEASPDAPIGKVVHLRYWAVQVVTDYNFYRWYKLTPYVGLGVGAGKSSYKKVSGFTQNAEDEYRYPTYSFSGKAIAIFSLRAGFELNTNVKLFFEQHFNTDNSRGSYFGVTYVL